MAAKAPNEVLKQHEPLPPIAKIAPPSLAPKSFFTSICSDGTVIRPSPWQRLNAGPLTAIMKHTVAALLTVDLSLIPM